MIPNPNLVLYWSATMLDSAPNLAGQIAATAASGVTTVLLWSIHVNANGDLNWNDGPPKGPALVQNGQFDPSGAFQQLAANLNTLLTTGSVRNVFLSIGAGGTSDFANIQSLLSTPQGTQALLNSFGVLLKALTYGGRPLITGFDFDDEDTITGTWDPNFQAKVDAVVQLSTLLKGTFNAAISYCPYNPSEYGDFWEACLEGVYSQMGSQIVTQFNVQAYSGGRPGDVATWAQLLGANSSKNGVANAWMFLVPGLSANDPGNGDMCPSDFAGTFQQWASEPLGGGFIWNSQLVFDNTTNQCNGSLPTLRQFVQAIG